VSHVNSQKCALTMELCRERIQDIVENRDGATLREVLPGLRRKQWPCRWYDRAVLASENDSSGVKAKEWI